MQLSLVGRELELGTFFVRFLRLLGVGGSGMAVYHVEKTASTSKEQEAFKCLVCKFSDRDSEPHKSLRDDLFNHELLYWKKYLTDSVNIVQLKGEIEDTVVLDGEKWYVCGIFMELSSLGDLAQYRSITVKQQLLDRQELRGIRQIMEDTAKGIRAGHEKHMIHCDIKPQNILIFSMEGRPFAKVMDFGAVKDINAAHRRQFATLRYMAPELDPQSGGGTATFESDIYSLGVVFYELLTGNVPEKPFNELRVANEKDEGIREIRDLFGEEMANLIRGMLARSAKDRPTISRVLSRLGDMNYKSQEIARNRPSQFVPENRYRWFPETHFAFNHVLVYIFTRPLRSRSLDEIKREVEGVGIIGFEIISVIGQYHYAIRAWISGDVDSKLRKLKESLLGDFDSLCCQNSNDLWSWYKRPSRGRANRNTRPANGEGSAGQILEIFDQNYHDFVRSDTSPNKVDEILKVNKIVHSVLQKDSETTTAISTRARRARRSSIRFYVRVITARSNVEHAVSRGIMRDIWDALENYVKNNELTVLHNSHIGTWIGMIKFRLEDFFEFSDVYAIVSETIKQYQRKIDVETETLIDFKRESTTVSDDGPLIAYIRREIEKKHDKI